MAKCRKARGASKRDAGSEAQDSAAGDRPLHGCQALVPSIESPTGVDDQQRTKHTRGSALGPRRRWEPRLCRRNIIRPYGSFLAILPLDGDRLVGDLESAVIDRKITQNSFCFESQKCAAQLVRIKAAGRSYGVHK